MTLDTRRLTCIADMQAFLDGSDTVHFEAPDACARRRWLSDLLNRFHYRSLSRADKGVLRRFACKLGGYSRAQLTRLIGQWQATGALVDRRGPPAKAFARRYTDADVAALVELDRLHQQLSGPATRKDARYERLASISVAHLYNLRASAGYRRQRGHMQHTQATKVPIGERRRPDPHGQPGYLRVDSVHQGDFEGVKGVYLINLVDAVTQYEVVGVVPRISENHLVPLLEQVMATFPFTIRGFHSDNGSEYINYRISGMLEKLHVEFTKSRPRRSNDNALAESKNASVIRKHLGYCHISARHARLVETFTQQHLTPYINFHRPCFFATTITDAKGKQRKRYDYSNMMTPYEKLKSLDDASRYLRAPTRWTAGMRRDVTATAIVSMWKIGIRKPRRRVAQNTHENPAFAEKGRCILPKRRLHLGNAKPPGRINPPNG